MEQNDHDVLLRAERAAEILKSIHLGEVSPSMSGIDYYDDVYEEAKEIFEGWLDGET